MVHAGEEGEGGSARATRRRGISKRQREAARELHRTHLLCLLARGTLYDSAANEPILQASARLPQLSTTYLQFIHCMCERPTGEGGWGRGTQEVRTQEVRTQEA
jgi:hypothetical protein